MKTNKKYNSVILIILLFIGSSFQETIAQVYISNFSDFPAYPFNTTSYKQSGRFVGCGPTTGAMIFVYFDQVHNLNNGLLTNPGTGVNKGLNTAWALHGSQYMKTQASGFGDVVYIKPGLEDYAEDQGYDIDVMIHVSNTYYTDPNASNAAWLNAYGPYGDAWNNDGFFWRNSGGDWSIDADDFCDFLELKLSTGIAVFLTIDTDEDGSGDHWVALVGYNKSTSQYAFYDTYSTTIKWADIHYCNAPGAKKDNAISLLRTVTYIGEIGGTQDPPLDLIALNSYNGAIPLAWNSPSGPYDPAPGPMHRELGYTERMPTHQDIEMMQSPQTIMFGSLVGPSLESEVPMINLKLSYAPLSTTVLTGYNVYRSTSQSGAYTKIASNISRQYYRDESVSDGQTYYYKVTAVHTSGESDFSNTANAQSQANGYTISSGWVTSAPTIDGVINTSEWSDAVAIDITYPGNPGTVTLRVMNDDNTLYLAVDDQRDTQLDDRDQFAIFFDDNLDREWPPSSPSNEGNFWIAWDAGDSESFTLFGPRYGYWPDGLHWPDRSTPAGVAHDMSASSGNVQYEGSIDLTTSPFAGSFGNKIGFLVFVYNNGATDFTSFWPQQAERLKVITPNIQYWGQAPFSFGDLIISDGTISNIPDAPSNLKLTNLSDQIHVTWQDNSDNETGLKLQTKETPGIAPIVWRDLATLGPNTTSYQMDNPVVGHTYYFRVAAFNADGTSAYSEEKSIYMAMVLNWLTVDAPSGGEDWGVGSSQQITWRNGTIGAPDHVTITYSTDGGSNWISPAIASSIPNSGSYNWTIPNTPATNCIVKVKNASSDFPYDLNNHPFIISSAISLPDLVVNPTTLNFGETTTSLTFNINNGGDGTLTWNIAESPDETWITSVSPSTGSNNGTITVTVDRSQLAGSSDTGALQVTSNGGNQSVTVNISKQSAQLPSHWSFTENTGKSATIVLPIAANPNIEGTPLQNEDYIGLFTQAGLCCGHADWMGQNISITAWGDNDQTQDVDGFAAGEEILYRVYRPCEQKEWELVDVSYSQGNGIYSTNGFMVLSQFDVTEEKTMTLNFASGWNMFSINVNPDDASLETVMNPVENEIVIMKNDDGQTYIPDFAINGIGDIDYKEGYQMYLSTASDLDVTGQPVDPTTPIDLNSGWSLFSYLPAEDMDISAALESINSQIMVVKDNEGQVYVPEYSIDNIGDMEPGQGYQVYLNASATLTYPAGSPAPMNPNLLAKQTMDSKITLEHFLFTPNTGENATVVITTDANPRYSDESPLENGDEIGVFTTTGLCCGAVVWDGINAALTVWGDDSQTQEVDGFQAGDTLRLHVWKQSSDVEYLAEVTFQTGHPVKYQANGFSVVTDLVVDLTTDVVEKEVSNLPSDLTLAQNYPNPFNPETTITFQLPQSADVEITIFDVLGNQIRKFPLGVNSPGKHKVLWNGKDEDGIQVASGIYFYKMVAMLQNKTHMVMKKMMVLK